MISRRIIISGRVQGVGYRAWAVATARRFELQGWVRNLSNGNVEAVFSGEEDDVVAMIEACKDGPPAARVDSIEQYACEEEPGSGFISKPTV